MRQLFVYAMYAGIWAMLICQIGIPNTLGYSVLTKNVETEVERKRAENKLTIEKHHQIIADILDHDTGLARGYERMLEVNRHSLSLSDYLDSIKNRIAFAAGGYVDSSFRLKNPENLSWEKRVLKGGNDADQIQERVNSLKLFFDDALHYDQIIPYPEYGLNWCIYCSGEGHNKLKSLLSRSTASSAIAILTSIQYIVSDNEAIVLHELSRRGRPIVDAFDAIASLVIPIQSYVVYGEQVTAPIFLAAFPTVSIKNIVCDKGYIRNKQERMLTWVGSAGTVGRHIVRGSIVAKTDSGEQIVPWEFGYRTGHAFAGISLDKMNVLYRGIDNPVTVKVWKGYRAAELNLIVPGAIVTKTGESTYTIRIKSKQLRKINALIIQGHNKGASDTLGGLTMLVKDLPLPLAAIGKEDGVSLTAAAFRERSELYIITDDDIGVSYKVLSYDISYLKKGDKDLIGPIAITGHVYSTNEIIGPLVKEAKVGDRILFTNIKVLGPGGETSFAAPLSYRLD